MLSHRFYSWIGAGPFPLLLQAGEHADRRRMWCGLCLTGAAFAAAASMLIVVLAISLGYRLCRIARCMQTPLLRNPLPSTVAGSPRILAVIIPAHDEAATVGGVVRGVPRSRLQALGLEPYVIVVDDGSSDGSGVCARQAGADQVLRKPSCRGLGAALRTGLEAACDAGARLAVYLDGDGEYDPRDIPAVIQPVLAGEADYVLGVRFPCAAQVMLPARLFGNRVFTLLVSLLIGRRIADGQTGIRAFSARALKCAEIVHDYNYAQVLTLNLMRKGMGLAEVPVSYRCRQHGASFIRYYEYIGRVALAMGRELSSP